ncbi:MAG: hypothetical protein ACXW3D_03725 [Caulobacteraceae bacterium]
MDEVLTLTHATERDVDLILVEELKCSPPFVRWFVQQVGTKVGRQLDCETCRVTHSKRRTYNRREIDITLEVVSSGRRAVFLIENKLDTSEQPRQAESYREEADLLVSQGAEAAFTVLVCPTAYAQSASRFAEKFDCVVAYEAVADFLAFRASQESGELADRLRHRRELVSQAITKARRGYEAVPLAEIERFNVRYVALLTEMGVDLPPGPSMLEPDRPGESKTMIFAPEALPKWSFLPQTRLVHQLREGNANINFYKWGNHFSHLAGAIAPALVGTSYRIATTGNKRVGGNSGLMIVVDTPSIDNLKGFDAQKDAIQEGIRRTAELKAWFSRNKSVIEDWANLARKQMAS